MNSPLTAHTPYFGQGIEALSPCGRSRGQRECEIKGERLCEEIYGEVWSKLQKIGEFTEL